MGNRRLRILQLSIGDSLGGAEKMAWDLFNTYRKMGHGSWLAVGYKTGIDPDVLQIPDSGPQSSGRWYNFWLSLNEKLTVQAKRRPFPGLGRLGKLTEFMSRPLKRMDELKGRTDYRFPSTRKLLKLVPKTPDVIHCHNLHGWYFDLRALPWLSRRKPVILSMHDAWLLTGLCCHSFECERWRTGCGQCPYLSMWQDTAVSNTDGTAFNWRQKKKIYARSRVRVTTACKWLMDRAEQSMLAPGIVEKRVIPYGIDMSRFRPAADKDSLRDELGLPRGALVLLFVGRLLGNNQSKDYQTLRTAVDLAARSLPENCIVLVCRGEELPVERYRNVEVRFQPWGNDFSAGIKFYQACDVYLHAAKIDTFPLSVLEAMACAAPVVGTAVGGIPEQIKSLDPEAGGIEGIQFGADKATGILVAPSNAERFARAITVLLGDHRLRRRIGDNACRDAHQRFDLHQQCRAYVQWYEEILAQAQPRDRRDWAPSV
jgi:glycosyltransferase involved in cell wall biosynthesis